jgi:hypothetical protein
MTWLDFVVLIFAASAIVDVWKNGSIFADWRAFLESSDDPTPTPDAELPPAAEIDITLADQRKMAGVPEPQRLPWLMRMADKYMPRFAAELFNCTFCFSHHTPWIVGVVCFFPALFVTTPWLAFLIKLPAYSLAATRIGNLINAVAPTSVKYDQ